MSCLLKKLPLVVFLPSSHGFPSPQTTQPPKPPPSSKRPQAEAKPCKALASPLRAKFESGSSPSAQGPKSSKAAFNALTDLVGNSLASWTGVTAEGAEGCHFYFSSLDGFCWGAKRKFKRRFPPQTRNTTRKRQSLTTRKRAFWEAEIEAFQPLF